MRGMARWVLSRPAMADQLRYPLGTHHADRVKTSTGRKLEELTLSAALDGKIAADDLRIAPETLELQARISDEAGRPQLAENFRRAAELTKVSDARILEIYNALRPGASSHEELEAIATELATQYGAKRNAAWVRSAADVYKRRNVLRPA